MAGKFEVYTEKPGVHRFRLKASNGSVLITSDAHESKESLLKSIESIRKLAPYAQVQEESAASA
ncbi:YegP family protein [Kitasatospora sp. NPDC056138]|uniref:YegP family protein n=1 Tax=Kitasatospora sp. NPDC056138 TaxID=3345724 RepID=UPI0035D7F1A6